MEYLSDKDAKTKAMERCQWNGHDMRRWTRTSGFRWRSSCRQCGHEAIVRSSNIGLATAAEMDKAGHIVGQTVGGFAGWDFTFVEGYAAGNRCRFPKRGGT